MNWLQNTFEISHSKHKTIRSMEGVRGIAAFLVFIVHYVTLFEPLLLQGSITAYIASYLHSMGDIGVDLFFVLSGYLIYGMLIKRPRPFNSYIFRRIQRIYPTFSAVFLFYICLSVIFPSESKIPEGWENAIIFLIENFLLLPGLFDLSAMITVAWSLSYEFFYYLLIPLLIALLSMRSWPAIQRIIFFISVSILFFCYFAIYGGHIRLLMFVAGILLYETIENKYFKTIPPLGIPAFLIAMFLVYYLKDIGADTRWKHFSLYILFYIFCLECFISSGFLTQMASSKPLRWFGNMSYSYYLIHGVTLKGFFIFLDKLAPNFHSDTIIIWLLLPLVFIITLVPSILLFVFIEKPYSIIGNKK